MVSKSASKIHEAILGETSLASPTLSPSIPGRAFAGNKVHWTFFFFRLTPGHLKDGSVDLNWDALVHPAQTIVFYMGLKGMETLCSKLIEHGMPTETPAALIQQGTTRHQRVIIGDLETLPGLVCSEEIHAPTLIIVGDVVKLHDKLNWFKPGEIE